MALIYEGDVLFAHHNPGDTPYLLVTFVGLYQEHAADTHYLMQELVEREGMACIGVTSRIRNFYLHEDMTQIAELIRKIRKPEQKIIAVGQSSGGFAATKFADAIKADYVLAFSPVFSAHESDLGITEDMQREVAFLRHATRLHRIDPNVIRAGMRPGPEDCSVPLFVVYDTGNANDAWAAECFAKFIPQTQLVRCTDLGHASFARIYDEQGHHLAAIIGNLAAGDEEGAVTGLRNLSRRSESAVATLMIRIARWRPWEVEKALRTERARLVLTEKTLQRHQFNDVMVFEYVKRGRLAEALAHLRTLHPKFFQEQELSQDSGTFLIFSSHGDILTYATEDSHVVMTPQGLFSRIHAPVLLDIRDGQPKVVLPTRGGQRTVELDPESAARDGAAFELVPVPGTGLTAFRRGETFLTADYGAVPRFGPSWVQDWEWFALIPLSPSALLGNGGSLNWFDQVSLAASEKTESMPATRPQRTSFRSLFQRYFS